MFKSQAVRTFRVLVPQAMTQLLTISANKSAKIPVAIPRTIFNPFLIPESAITWPTSKFSKALLNMSKLMNSPGPDFSLPGQIFNDRFQINSIQNLTQFLQLCLIIWIKLFKRQVGKIDIW